MKVLRYLTSVCIALVLAGCQSSNVESTSTQNYLSELDKVAPNHAFMTKWIAQARQEKCAAPYTIEALKQLSESDPMVVIGASFRESIPRSEFPTYLTAMKQSFDCDSEQWIKRFKQYLGACCKKLDRG
ncbi:hypothetical protein ACPV5O_26795 [Vibrio maritimus]|uniref:hypothetical protein n=1 Tax=Vibrio maritimus TaxID=990268 RepID=UPI004067A646